MVAEQRAEVALDANGSEYVTAAKRGLVVGIRKGFGRNVSVVHQSPNVIAISVEGSNVGTSNSPPTTSVTKYRRK